MPILEVELADADLELLGVVNTDEIERRLSQLISQGLSDLAEDASLYPAIARPIRRARLKLVVDNEGLT